MTQCPAAPKHQWQLWLLDELPALLSSHSPRRQVQMDLGLAGNVYFISHIAVVPEDQACAGQCAGWHITETPCLENPNLFINFIYVFLTLLNLASISPLTWSPCLSLLRICEPSFWALSPAPIPTFSKRLLAKVSCLCPEEDRILFLIIEKHTHSHVDWNDITSGFQGYLLYK